MKFSVSKESFLNNLLVPVSKLTDSLLLSFVTKDSETYIKTLVTSSDNSIIFQSCIECKGDVTNRIIIPDVKTFLRLVSSITENVLVFDVNNNTILYNQKNLSFKYHLLDENYFSNKKSINEEKIDSLSFDTSFNITKSKLSEILKFNSIVPDAEKIYFVTNSNTVLAKIGDNEKSNTNEITLEVSSQYNGEGLDETFPLNIQNILLLSFYEEEILVSINKSLKIFKFETPNSKYTISGLVK